MKEKHQFCDLGNILTQMSKSEWNCVMIGGHAINCWAEHFRRIYPEMGWDEFFPFVSEDLDYLGSRDQLIDLGKIFQGKTDHNWGEFKGTPVLGTFFTENQGKQLQIDVLHNVMGVSLGAPDKMALKILSATTPAVEVKLLHPVQCIESKLWNLHSLDQQNRQDEKHLKMASQSLYCYLLEGIHDPKSVIRTAQYIFSLASTECGLDAYFKHGISLIDSIPLKEMQDSPDKRFTNFKEKNLGRLQKCLSESRTKYEATRRKINSLKPESLKRPDTLNIDQDSETDSPDLPGS